MPTPPLGIGFIGYGLIGIDFTLAGITPSPECIRYGLKFSGIITETRCIYRFWTKDDTTAVHQITDFLENRQGHILCAGIKSQSGSIQ